MLALKAAAFRDRLAVGIPDLAVTDYRPGDTTVRVSKPGGVVISCAFDAPVSVETMLFYNGRIDQSSQRHHTSFGSIVYYMQRGYINGPLTNGPLTHGTTSPDHYCSAPPGPVDYQP
jgi:hypothetical protein